MSNSWKIHIRLENPEYFDFGNGLWKGKKPPFQSVNVIRNTNFTNSGKIDYSDVAVLEVEKKQFQSRKLIKGDIIIERSGGGPKQPVGRVVYFDKNNGDYSFSNFTSRIRVINDELNSKFVFYYLMYFYDAGNTFEMQAQTTGIRNLDFTKYKNSVRVPLIPLPEQRKIAYVLSTVQKAIKQQDKFIRITTQLKKALMQKLFTEGIHNEKQKQTEIGLVPESWEVVKIGDIIEKWFGGGTPSTKNSEYWKGNNPWITSKWLSDKLELDNGEKFISDEGIKNSATSIVPVNSLIFATRVGVGKIGINMINLSINQDLAGGQLKPGYDIYFVAYQFQLEKIQLEIESFKRGATIKGITRDNLKGIQMVVPKSKNEQERISRIIKLIDSKVENHQKKKQTLSDLFKTLLHELMTGQRRVHEIEFEALSKIYKLGETPLRKVAEE